MCPSRNDTYLGGLRAPPMSQKRRCKGFPVVQVRACVHGLDTMQSKAHRVGPRLISILLVNDIAQLLYVVLGASKRCSQLTKQPTLTAMLRKMAARAHRRRSALMPQCGALRQVDKAGGLQQAGGSPRAPLQWHANTPFPLPLPLPFLHGWRPTWLARSTRS